MYKIILLLLLSITSSACQEKSQEALLRVAISPDYPPFEYKKDGQIIGFDIDLATMIAAKLNKPLSITELDFASLIPALQSGKVDMVMSGLTVTPEREANIDFSQVYYQASIAGLYFPKQNIHNSDELAGKKIGVQLGTVMEIFAKEQQKLLPSITITSLANNLHLLQELKLKRIDILLLEAAQIPEFLKGNPDLASVVFPKTGSGYAIGLKKNASLKLSINQALQELINSGALKQLETKWLEP